MASPAVQAALARLARWRAGAAHRARVYHFERVWLASDPRLARPGGWPLRALQDKLSALPADPFGQHPVEIVADPKIARPRAELFFWRIRLPAAEPFQLFILFHEHAHLLAHESAHGRGWWRWYERLLATEVGVETAHLMRQARRAGLRTA